MAGHDPSSLWPSVRSQCLYFPSPSIWIPSALHAVYLFFWFVQWLRSCLKCDRGLSAPRIKKWTKRRRRRSCRKQKQKLLLYWPKQKRSDFREEASHPCPDAGETAAHQSPWQPNGALQHGALMRPRASSRWRSNALMSAAKAMNVPLASYNWWVLRAFSV